MWASSISAKRRGSIPIDQATTHHLIPVICRLNCFSHESPAASEPSERPDGHVVRFAPGSQQIVGLTIINARQVIERDGRLAVSEHVRLPLWHRRFQDARSLRRISRGSAAASTAHRESVGIGPGEAAGQAGAGARGLTPADLAA